LATQKKIHWGKEKRTLGGGEGKTSQSVLFPFYKRGLEGKSKKEKRDLLSKKGEKNRWGGGYSFPNL